MSGSAEYFWRIASVLFLPIDHQIEVIESWFLENKQDFKPTENLSVIVIFMHSLLVYSEGWRNEFDLDDACLDILYEKYNHILEKNRSKSLLKLLLSEDWQQLKNIIKSMLEQVGLEPDLSITSVNYLEYIEIWTDEDNNIAGINC